eukprot:5708076-Pleurochrysis_carterae.AAC.1
MNASWLVLPDPCGPAHSQRERSKASLEWSAACSTTVALWCSRAEARRAEAIAARPNMRALRFSMEVRLPSSRAFALEQLARRAALAI